MSVVTSKRGALNACYVIFLDLTEWKNLNHYLGREQLVRIQVTYVLYLLQRQENLSSEGQGTVVMAEVTDNHVLLLLFFSMCHYMAYC